MSRRETRIALLRRTGSKVDDRTAQIMEQDPQITPARAELQAHRELADEQAVAWNETA